MVAPVRISPYSSGVSLRRPRSSAEQSSHIPHMPVPTDQLRSALALLVLASHASFAQARVVSAPPEASLLNITRQWSRASSLGDLRELRGGPGYLELRVWGGYALETRTQGVVLRRDGGRWSAFLAQVMRCEMQIPGTAWDTASAATMRHYTEEARRQCGTRVTDVGPGTRILVADSLVVERLGVPDSTIEHAWTAAVRAGAFKLPGRVERERVTDAAFTYVVELRSGGDYRAAAIEHLEPPETEADRQVRAVYAAVSRVLTPELLLTP